MPEDFVRSQPWLCIFQAWIVRRAGRLDAVERLVRDAEQALKSESAPIASDSDLKAIRANIATLHAYMAIFNGEISRAIELSHQALELFPPDDLIRGVTSVTLGLAYRMKSDLTGAVKAFAEARSMSQKMGNVFLTHIATWHMGYTLMLQGQLHHAIGAYRESLELASEQGKQGILYSGQPKIYIGSILREWNELEAAETHLREGIELCEPTRLLDALTDGYLAMARLRLAQGDLNGARDACADARQTLQVPNPDPVSLIRADDCRIRVWLAQGKYQEAARWAEESGLTVDDELSYVRELEHISLARVLVALGREQPEGSHTDDALNLLARLLEAAEMAGWMEKAVEILVLQALAFQVKGEEEAALAALGRALSLAEPQGYVRTFVDEGAPMAVLLHKAATSGLAPDHANKLLAAFGAEAQWGRGAEEPEIIPSPPPPGPPSPWPLDPLSEREREVLRLLATELSGPEIAGELTVALSTVRYHTNNIYSKLCVHNRRAAIRRAEELSLL
jgi:LuxR family maltose regulon positive regulatory protein